MNYYLAHTSYLLIFIAVLARQLYLPVRPSYFCFPGAPWRAPAN